MATTHDRGDTTSADVCLTFLVRQTWLSMRSAMDAALAEHGLSAAQYATLIVLDDQPGISTAEVARTVATTRQSANELVAGLVQDGLVERRPHPRDGRSQQLLLTDTGRRRLAAARPAVSAREQQLEAGLTEEERLAARVWLTAVTAKGQPEPASTAPESRANRAIPN